MVSELKAQGWRVRTLARSEGRVLGVDEIPGDLAKMLQLGDWQEALTGVSVVVNAAGILRETQNQTFEIVHVKAPLALAGACAARGIRFVQVSALGDPRDGGFIETKHRFDNALLALPVDAIVLRPSIVYSASGSFGGTSLLRALSAFPFRHLLPGKGKWSFHPTSAEDLARVVAAACTKGRKGIYDVGSLDAITLKDYQAAWRQWFGVPGKAALHVPLGLVRAQVKISELLGRGPVSEVIWKMLLREQSPIPGSSLRLHAEFGVEVEPLWKVLESRPSQPQDRQSAQLYFLTPWLKWSMVALWLLSGIVGLITPAATIEALSSGSWLAHVYPVVLARATGALDIALALWLARSTRPQWPVLGMLGMATGYLALFALALPGALMDPLGSLIKNIAIIPALAVLWVLVERR